MRWVGHKTAWLGRRLLNLITISGLALPVVLAGCGGDYPQTTIDPVSGDFGSAIQSLYRLVFIWTLIILVLVWGILGYILIRYRARPGGPEPTKTRGHLGLEIGWTLGAAVIVVLISIPTVQTVFRTQAAPGPDALVVEVIGRQWWWEFRYPAEGVVTANELHLPVGRRVDLQLRSADVIHSFWVPRLGGKRDVNPWVRDPDAPGPKVNRLTFTVDEPGIYPGQCAEFCGPSHGLMGMRVIAEDEDAFQDWVRHMQAATPPDSGSLADQGREIFMRSSCIACHAIAGTSAQGAIGPNLTRLGARTTIGAGLLENTRENLLAWIRDPARFKPGVKMPGTQAGGGGLPPTGLTEEQLEAVTAYLASLQ